MIRYYRWRSSYLGGMVCIIRGVCGVHRVVYGSVVSIEGYTGPEWAYRGILVRSEHRGVYRFVVCIEGYTGS